MNELLKSISETIEKKKVTSLCKKLLKKCKFNSLNDMQNLSSLILWLYVYGYYEKVLEISEIIKDVQFSGDYTLWDNFDSILCIKARILREKGDLSQAQEIIDFVNQYRHPSLYNNSLEWYNETLERNIKASIETFHSKTNEYAWRMTKLNFAISRREAGKYPISDNEFEQAISEQISILSNVK